MPKVLEIPPNSELFEDVEEHPEQQPGHAIRIEFYKTPEGSYFVWPYVRRQRGDGDVAKHFQVLRHFSDKKAARDAALVEGQSLIESGFDLEQMA